LYSIIQSLVAFPLTLVHFALNSFLRRYMFGVLKPGFRSLATLKLLVNIVGNFKPKRTGAASRGFLAIAWLYYLLIYLPRDMSTKYAVIDVVTVVVP